jgi:hypothetical protein
VKWPRIDPAASDDIDRAKAYFAANAPAVQGAFASLLLKTLSQIATSPNRFSRLETNTSTREIRRAVLRRFKYLVIFEATATGPLVLAVMHASRQPDAWRRLEDAD